MRDLTLLLVHLIATVVLVVRPGGLRSVIAESVLIKHQLLVVSRSRRRAHNLRPVYRRVLTRRRHDYRVRSRAKAGLP